MKERGAGGRLRLSFYFLTTAFDSFDVSCGFCLFDRGGKHSDVSIDKVVYRAHTLLSIGNSQWTKTPGKPVQTLFSGVSKGKNSQSEGEARKKPSAAKALLIGVGCGPAEAVP